MRTFQTQTSTTKEEMRLVQQTDLLLGTLWICLDFGNATENSLWCSLRNYGTASNWESTTYFCVPYCMASNPLGSFIGKVKWHSDCQQKLLSSLLVSPILLPDAQSSKNWAPPPCPPSTSCSFFTGHVYPTSPSARLSFWKSKIRGGANYGACK